MNIQIKVIDHKDQRYETAGDWDIQENGDIYIYVSKLSDWRYEMLIAIHELFEVLVCKHRGISQESVEVFDKNFEIIRKEWPIEIGDMEPGNMISAPYHEEHVDATRVEKLLAQDLDVNWNEYDTELENLSQ